LKPYAHYTPAMSNKPEPAFIIRDAYLSANIKIVRSKWPEVLGIETKIAIDQWGSAVYVTDKLNRFIAFRNLSPFLSDAKVPVWMHKVRIPHQDYYLKTQLTLNRAIRVELNDSGRDGYAYKFLVDLANTLRIEIEE
jgi:hypothetical protein